jgi:transcription termination/antitermination protein NusA
MKSDFMAAINQVIAEKGISKEVVVGAIEAALVSAYKRNIPGASTQDVVVRLDRETGESRVYVKREVVDVVRDPKLEMTLDEAHRISPGAHLGDVVEEESTPSDFGRIAAQTAKQVILQRLREAERELVFSEFNDREGDIVTGVIQRADARAVVVDLGKAEATLPPTEQVSSETGFYRPGRRMKFYLLEIHRTPKGPQIVVSRSHRNLVRRLLELEVPEIFNGTVEIRAIAREPGSRSKVAVSARQDGVDPVGACVGIRGVRIQNVVNELSGERIDVIEWNADPATFVGKALSPAQVVSVTLNEAEKTATVIVPERQLSLAIGKEGQNARLAAKLTNWRVDIKPAALARPGEVQQHELERRA